MVGSLEVHTEAARHTGATLTEEDNQDKCKKGNIGLKTRNPLKNERKINVKL